MIVRLSQTTGRYSRSAATAFALVLGTAFCIPLAPPFLHSARADQIVSVHVRERLSHYGAWQTSRHFGSVWVPTVDAHWRPYTVGEWVWTNDGWYWQSTEPFGEIVFHYGRWAYDPDLGWVWVTGDQWAPAWVVWRESHDDIGWMPAPPQSVDVVVEDNWWSFVPVAAIGAANLVSVVRPVSENTVLVQNTTIINQKTVINETTNPGTVRIGQQPVPINAGPVISQLPAQVADKVRAASLTPPKAGTFSAAQLDKTRGAEMKQKAAELKPAEVPSTNPVAKEQKPAVTEAEPSREPARDSSTTQEKSAAKSDAKTKADTKEAENPPSDKRKAVERQPKKTEQAKRAPSETRRPKPEKQEQHKAKQAPEHRECKGEGCKPKG